MPVPWCFYAELERPKYSLFVLELTRRSVSLSELVGLARQLPTRLMRRKITSQDQSVGWSPTWQSRPAVATMTEQQTRMLIRIRFELNKYLMVKTGTNPRLESSPEETRRLIRELDAYIISHQRPAQLSPPLPSQESQ